MQILHTGLSHHDDHTTLKPRDPLSVGVPNSTLQLDPNFDDGREGYKRIGYNWPYCFRS